MTGAGRGILACGCPFLALAECTHFFGHHVAAPDARVEALAAVIPGDHTHQDHHDHVAMVLRHDLGAATTSSSGIKAAGFADRWA